MLQALIFDFDGLIIDSEITVLISWQELYREYGHELPVADWLRSIGTAYSRESFDPYADLEARLGHSLDWETVDKRRYQRELELVRLQPILPGVTRLIAEAEAAGVRLAIGSSSDRQWVDGHLRRLGLYDHFDAIICADDVARVKPEPDLFLKAAEAVGAPPKAVIVLEDSPHGAAAARYAGMFCVIVPNKLTRRMNFSAADMLVNSLADVTLADLEAALADHR